MMRNELIVMFLLAGMSLGLSAQTETAPPDVSYETDVSQTSVWPGDRIHYLITLTVEADLQVNLEDFNEENVSFEPFHLIEMQQTREEVGSSSDMSSIICWRTTKLGTKGWKFLA